MARAAQIRSAGTPGSSSEPPAGLAGVAPALVAVGATAGAFAVAGAGALAQLPDRSFRPLLLLAVEQPAELLAVGAVAGATIALTALLVAGVAATVALLALTRLVIWAATLLWGRHPRSGALPSWDLPPLQPARGAPLPPLAPPPSGISRPPQLLPPSHRF